MSAVAFSSYNDCQDDSKDLFCKNGDLKTVDNNYLRSDTVRTRIFVAVVLMAHVHAAVVYLAYFKTTLEYKDAAMLW